VKIKQVLLDGGFYEVPVIERLKKLIIVMHVPRHSLGHVSESKAQPHRQRRYGKSTREDGASKLVTG